MRFRAFFAINFYIGKLPKKHSIYLHKTPLGSPCGVFSFLNMKKSPEQHLNDDSELKIVVGELAKSNHAIADSLRETAKSHKAQADSRVHERENMVGQMQYWGDKIDSMTESTTNNVQLLCETVVKQNQEQSKLLIEQNEKTLTEVNKCTDGVNKLVVSVGELTTEFRHQRSDHDKVEKRVDDIEKKQENTAVSIGNLNTKMTFIGAGALVIVPLAMFLLNFYRTAKGG